MLGVCERDTGAESSQTVERKSVEEFKTTNICTVLVRERNVSRYFRRECLLKQLKRKCFVLRMMDPGWPVTMVDRMYHRIQAVPWAQLCTPRTANRPCVSAHCWTRNTSTPTARRASTRTETSGGSFGRDSGFAWAASAFPGADTSDTARDEQKDRVNSIVGMIFLKQYAKNALCKYR